MNKKGFRCVLDVTVFEMLRQGEFLIIESVLNDPDQVADLFSQHPIREFKFYRPEPDRSEYLYASVAEGVTERIIKKQYFIQESIPIWVGKWIKEISASIYKKLSSIDYRKRPTVTQLFIDSAEAQTPETPANERMAYKRNGDLVVCALDSDDPYEDLARICARMNHPRPVSRS